MSSFKIIPRQYIKKSVWQPGGKRKKQKDDFFAGWSKSNAVAPLKIDTAGNFFCKDLKKGKKRKTNMKKNIKKQKTVLNKEIMELAIKQLA